MRFFKSKKKKQVDERTDEYLLQMYRKTGASIYFEELYDRYIPLVYGVCLKYLENIEQAQNATIRIFEDLLLKIQSLDIVSFGSWLNSVTKKHCIDVLKSQKTESLVDLDESVEQINISLTEYEANENYESAVEHCKTELEEKERTILESFCFENMSYADISKSLNMDVKDVKSQVINIQRNFKSCIQKRLQNENS